MWSECLVLRHAERVWLGQATVAVSHSHAFTLVRFGKRRISQPFPLSFTGIVFVSVKIPWLQALKATCYIPVWAGVKKHTYRGKVSRGSLTIKVHCNALSLDCFYDVYVFAFLLCDGALLDSRLTGILFNVLVSAMEC